MIRIFIIFVLLLYSFCSNCSYALEIVFPQKNPYSTYASETYISGNVDKKSKLFINDEPVKVFKNGVFCYTSSLVNGENCFLLTEKNKNKTVRKKVIITKISAAANKNTSYQKPPIKKFDRLLMGYVNKNNVPLRKNPSENAERLTHIPVNTILFPCEEYGNWYRLFTNSQNEKIWINKNYIKIFDSVNEIKTTNIYNAGVMEDNDFLYLNFTTDMRIPYKLKENKNNIELTLFNISNIDNLSDIIKNQTIFSKIDLISFKDNIAVLSFQSNEKLWGYDAEYSGNTFIFKKRKKPSFNKKYPLKNIVIAIDPGHGGSEIGAPGLFDLHEKDINLDISLKLKKILEKKGAIVIMTRTADEYVEIYKRPDIANSGKALICLSIHANSIVNGNPYKKHGVSTFYYNEYAKDFADIIKQQMINDLNLQDDGTNFASFVLTRPTMPLSVLIETAYIPNPEEYSKLCSNHFRTKVAKSIYTAIKNYIEKFG